MTVKNQLVREEKKVIFATYSVWNEEKGMGDRTELILQELTRIQADLVALQEVTPRLQHQHLARLAGYPYSEFRQYAQEEEGLAVLSRYPLTGSTFLHEEAAYGYSAALHGQALRPTLDCVHNPRWAGRCDPKPTIAPENFDRLYVMDDGGECLIRRVELFGTQKDEESGLCPSDHYGVLAELEWLG